MLMDCIYVWRPIMEASSTLENIRPPVVSRWSRKVNNCLRLQCQNILYTNYAAKLEKHKLY